MGVTQKIKQLSLFPAIHHPYKVARTAWREFHLDDGFNLSASMSFFAILCLIPLVLIVISIMGHWLGQSDAVFEQVHGWIEATLPQVPPDFIEFLRSLVDRKLTSGWLGIAFLFFVASFLFTNIEHILDKVLKSGRKRNFWHSRALSIGLIFFTAVLLLVPAQINLVNALLPERLRFGEYFGWFRGPFAYFFSHVLVFFLLLRVVPNREMRSKEILIGAVLFGAFTLLARGIFRWYMSWALERYAFVYGSLTVLVTLVLWIYYWSLLFVFCAEVVSSLQKLFSRESPAG